jgi:hypothetical protein
MIAWNMVCGMFLLNVLDVKARMLHVMQVAYQCDITNAENAAHVLKVLRKAKNELFHILVTTLLSRIIGCLIIKKR